MSLLLTNSMEQILDRFHKAWNDGPTAPRIEEFAPPAGKPDYLPMMVELFKIDMERRLRRGEQPSLDEYRQRFPACADAVAACFEEARAAADRAASPDKETDDPGIPPTLDTPSPPTVGLPLRLVGEYEVLAPLG